MFSKSWQLLTCYITIWFDVIVYLLEITIPTIPSDFTEHLCLSYAWISEPKIKWQCSTKNSKNSILAPNSGSNLFSIMASRMEENDTVSSLMTSSGLTNSLKNLVLWWKHLENVPRQNGLCKIRKKLKSFEMVMSRFLIELQQPRLAKAQ